MCSRDSIQPVQHLDALEHRDASKIANQTTVALRDARPDLSARTPDLLQCDTSCARLLALPCAYAYSASCFSALQSHQHSWGQVRRSGGSRLQKMWRLVSPTTQTSPNLANDQVPVTQLYTDYSLDVGIACLRESITCKHPQLTVSIHLLNSMCVSQLLLVLGQSAASLGRTKPDVR